MRRHQLARKARLEAKRKPPREPREEAPRREPRYSRWLTKRHEVHDDVPTRYGPPRPRDIDLAYAAGLIVGEGSFGGIGSGDASVQMQLAVTDPQPLLLLRRIFGGKMYGPYRNSGGDGCRRQSMWAWRLRGPALLAALPLLDKWLPPSRKREQFLAWCARCGFVLSELGEPQNGEMFIVEHVKADKVRLAPGGVPLSTEPYGLELVGLTGVAAQRPERSEASENDDEVGHGAAPWRLRRTG